MKTVLVLGTTFPRFKGDTEPAFVYELSNRMAKNGYRVIVLVPHDGRAKRYEKMGMLEVYRYPYFYPFSWQKLCYDGGIIENLEHSFLAKIQLPLLFLSMWCNIRKFVLTKDIDFVHAHWIIPEGLLASVYRRKVPYLVTAHAGDVFTLRLPILRWMGKRALSHCRWCTVNSTATGRGVLQIHKPRAMSLIPMGVDLHLFSPGRRNEKLRQKYGMKGHFLLSVGRLAEKKGLDYLLKALPAVLAEFPDAKLIIVGDGPQRKPLEKLAGDLKIRENVLFVGKIPHPQLAEYFATADIFIGPSIITKGGDTEGVGVVFFEGIASGTCVIGSDVGGIPDIIKHKKTGLLVEQKNISELSSAIIFALSHPDLCKKFVRQGQFFVKKNFSWDIVVKKFENIYRQM